VPRHTPSTAVKAIQHSKALLRFLTQSENASKLEAHFIPPAGFGYNPLAGRAWHPASEFLERRRKKR
jgi:hypothetical protein